MTFEVDRGVLIPRPETETLVEAALERLPNEGRVLELCTGSACVAVALATERPALVIDAVDISRDACRVAEKNLRRHHLQDRIRIYEGDLFAPIPHGDGQTILREALLVADHNAYHLGQLVLLRRCLGIWDE